MRSLTFQLLLALFEKARQQCLHCAHQIVRLLFAEFFGLFHTHLSVRSGLDFLNWCFDSLVEEWSYMKGFVAS